MDQFSQKKYNLVQLGSEIAKNGFKTEKHIIDKFNNWENDRDTKNWLIHMGYELNKIEKINAKLLFGFKSDIKVVIKIKLKNEIISENVQVKLVSNQRGFNQVDKRWLKSYKQMWNIPEKIYQIFAYYTGELKPYRQNTNNKKRMFANEFNEDEQKIFLNWIIFNKLQIINDILKGSGENSVDWFLIVQKSVNTNIYLIKNIDEVIEYYLDSGEVVITKRGQLKLVKSQCKEKVVIVVARALICCNLN
nr:hypothetical protein [Mycoplasmopsis phocirhinis]